MAASETDDPRARPDGWHDGTTVLQEHGMRLLHLEGDRRGLPLCEMHRHAPDDDPADGRSHRMKLAEAPDIFPCPACVAVENGDREPGYPGGGRSRHPLDRMEDRLVAEAREFHHGDR